DALPDGGFGMMDSIFRKPVRVLRRDASEKIAALLAARGLMERRGWGGGGGGPPFVGEEWGSGRWRGGHPGWWGGGEAGGGGERGNESVVAGPGAHPDFAFPSPRPRFPDDGQTRELPRRLRHRLLEDLRPDRGAERPRVARRHRQGRRHQPGHPQGQHRQRRY